MKDYLEQYVWRPANHWKSMVHSASLPVCIVALVLAGFYSVWTLVLESPEFHSDGDYILIVALFLLAGAAFAGKKFLGESMDYTFSGGEFGIARVIDDSRRVQLANFDMAKVEIFASVKHEDYARYQAMADIKPICGYLDENEKLYFVVYTAEDKKILLTFQPNAEMVELLAASNPEVSKL